ncbi:MAG: S9 family peptidase [Dokdonella sp.]|uniref:S9 family peptidase n=1 Tax=Dokdonella sp. TaxID=2291710 RepID=UPI0032641FE8
MSIRLSIVILVALAAGQAVAAPAAGPSRTFKGADLFNLEVAADPQISPDGKTIAYARRANDIMTDRTQSSIWSIDVASGMQVPLITGPGSHGQPRWSPDGSRLAYISSADDKAGAQLYVRWMKTGATARITGLADTPHAISWSADGERIAYTMFVPDESTKLGKAPDKPADAKWAEPLQIIDTVVYRTDDGGYEKAGYEQLFWVPASGGAPTQLTFGALNAGGKVSWSPDGHAIVFSANLTKDWQRELVDTEIHEVSIDTLAVRTLTKRKGPDDWPAISPDGKSIAYLGFDDRYVGYQNRQLSVMNRDGSGTRVLSASLDRTVENPVWSADGRSIYVNYDEHGSERVARIGLDGSIHTVAEHLTDSAFDRPYSGGQFSVARDGTVAFTSGTTQRPSDVWIARGNSPRQLTHLNASSLGAKSLGQVQTIAVKSFDDLPIDAWLITPPDFDPSKKYPMILEIHGGPFAAYGPTFSSDDQLYAAAGYAVLYINPRGSTGYGEVFANKIDKAYPGRDYDDLIAAVDAAIAKGFIDPDNLFVTGGSGGGVLTAWIVGKTDRFRAAATQKPVIDWASFVLTADGTPFFSRYWFGKFPWEDPAGYWARSPLSLVGNVKTPTLVVVGSNDFRTPVSEAEQYYEALQLRNVPTTLVKVPGANHHGLAERPSQSAAKAAAILAWFERYRKGAAASTTAPTP